MISCIVLRQTHIMTSHIHDTRMILHLKTLTNKCSSGIYVFLSVGSHLLLPFETKYARIAQ